MTLKFNCRGKKTAFIFDFDGTITEEDIFDAIFAKYADPAWLVAHRDYHASKITLKEAYLEMSRYFRGSRKEIHNFLKQKARLRKGFRQLLSRLRENGVRAMIVSNGFDFYIDFLLRRWRIWRADLEIRCHHAEVRRNRFIPSFNEHRNLKHPNCLIGKAETVEELKREGYFICFCGNGYSDSPAAAIADLVFARGELAEYCQERGIKHIRFKDFRDVLAACFGEPKA